MSLVIKTPITAEQQAQQVSAQENEAAIREVKELIRNETAARAAADSETRQDLSALRGVVTAEIESRTTAQSQIQADLLTETNQRAAADNELQNAINNEKSARETFEGNLRDELTNAIENEKNERTQAVADAIAAIQVAMGNTQRLQEIENENLRRQIEAEAANQGTTVSELNDRVANEEATRAAEDTRLSNALAAEEAARADAVSGLRNSLTSTINSKVDAEEAARTSSFNQLQASLNSKIDSETAARNTAINQLQASLNSKIETETAARTEAVNQLQSALNSEKSAREALADNLATETQNCTDAITALDSSLKSYVNTQISNVEENLNDFTAPTATAAGKRGLVPAPAKGTTLKILTSHGWREPDDATLTISTLPAQVGSLTYNGAVQSPTWLNFDNKKLKIEGTTTATNAGSYTVTFTPIDLYIWADTLDQSPKSQTWKIDALKLAKPTAAVTEFTFNGNAQGIAVSNFDGTYESQTGTVSSTNAGNFTATYKLRNKNNTTWSDNSTDDVAISWKINPLKLTKPTVSSTTFTFDGAPKSLNISNFNATYESQTGVISATDAGNYTATFKLKNSSNTKWADNSTADVVISWKINVLKLPKPAASNTSFAFDGSTKNLSVAYFNSDYESQSGTVSGVNAGNYSVTFKLISTSNTHWADDSTADIVISWQIEPLKLTKPTAAVTEFQHDSTTKTLEIANFDAAFETQAGTTSATEIGSYTVTFKLKNTSNTKWADNSVADVVITWEIKQSRLTAAQSTGFEQVGSLTFTCDSSQAVTLTPTIKNFDSEVHVLSGTTSAQHAGTFTLKIAPKSGRKWYDGTDTPIDVQWTIQPRYFPRLTAVEVSFVYDGNQKELRLSNFNSTYMIGGFSGYTYSATVPNTYVAKYSFRTLGVNAGDLLWEGGGSDDILIEWEIGYRMVAPPTPTATSFVYDGVSHSPQFSGFVSDYMHLSQDTQKIDAGQYVCVVSFKNYPYSRWIGYEDADSVSFNWEITPKKLTAAQSSGFAQLDSLTYNTAAQSPVIKNFDSDFHTLSGTTSAVDAGTYTAYVNLKTSNLAWNDGTSAPKAVSWSIQKRTLTKPTLSQASFTYNGNNINAFADYLANFDDTYMICEGTKSAKNVGQYSFVVKLRSTSNLVWSGGTTSNLTFNWQITPIGSAGDPSKLAQDGSLTYSGSSQSVAIKNFDSSCHTLSGTTSATNAGSYIAKVSPKDGYTFNDGSTAAKDVVWSIQKLAVTAPTVAETEFIYDGNAKTLEVTGYDSNRMTRSGTVSATNAGSYSVTFSLKDSNNTQWSTGSTSPVVFNWSIGLTKVALPYISGQNTYTYNGNSRSPTIIGFNANTMSKSGDISAVNAGVYRITISLLDTTGYVWSNNTTGDITLTWKINRKPLTANQSTFSQSGSLTYTGSSQSVTISNFNANYHSLSGVLLSADAGTFVAKVSPLDNYCWNDSTAAPKNVVWTIDPVKLTKPSASVTAFTYDKQAHALNISNFNSSFITQKGTVSATNAGSYTATFSLKNTGNSTWADGSTADVIISWAISKKVLPKPFLSVDSFTYTGGTQTVTVNNFDGSYMTQRGVNQATNSGSYSVAFDLIDNTLAEWDDGSTSAVYCTWFINRARINLAGSTFYQIRIPKYSGSSVEIISSQNYFESFNFNTQVWSGTTSATDAGSYTAYVEPNSNYTWCDGTTSKKTVTWTIDPAVIAPPEIDSSVTLTYSGVIQSPTLKNYNPDKMTLGSDTSKLNAGDYTLTVTPNSNFVWSTGNRDTLNLPWRINFLVPSNSLALNTANFEYTGAVIDMRNFLTGFDPDTMTISGDYRATNVGSYSFYVSFKIPTSSADDPARSYGFSTTSRKKFFTWNITHKKLALPTLKSNGVLSDTGAAQFCFSNYLDGFDSNLIEVSGTTSATAPGNYSCTLKLLHRDSSCWANYSVKDLTFYWSIGLTKITAPSLSTSYFDYDGAAHSVSITGFDSTKMTKSGTESATNSGNYQILIYLNDSTNNCWSTGGSAPIKLSWSIGQKYVPKPVITGPLEFTYDGSAKSLTVEGFDSNAMTQTGYLSATDSGTYTVSFLPKSGTACQYYWADSTGGYVSFTWKINKAALPEVSFSQSGSLTYDGTAKTVTIKNFDASKHDISSDTSATNAGTYTAKISPKANYTWADGTTTAESVSWKINPKVLPKPTASTRFFQYNGSAKSLTISNFDSTYMEQLGTTSDTNASVHDAVFRLQNSINTKWEDGTIQNVNLPWLISPIILNVPTVSPQYQASKGLTKSHSVTVYNFKSDKMTQTGTTSVDSGAPDNYFVSFALTDKTNYVWDDSSTSDKKVYWYVEKKKLSLDEGTFSQTSAVVYDGNEHSITEACSGVKADYIGEYYTVTNSSATKGGVTSTITPTNAATWADGTTTAKSVSWSISGAVPSFALAKTFHTATYPDQLNINSDTERSFTVNFTTDSPGDVTYTSSDAGVVLAKKKNFNYYLDGSCLSNTVSASTGKITLHPIANGSATVTVTQAASGGFAAVTKFLTVNVSTAVSRLTPLQLSQAASNGSLLNLMRIGDVTESIHLEGTVGKLSLNGDYCFRLIAYNHNSGFEGENYAYFALATPSTTGITCLTDSDYGTQVDTDDGFTFATADNAGVTYIDSPLRTRCSEFYNLLPWIWTNVIHTPTKAFCMDVAGDYNWVNDKIWLPSVGEFGYTSASANPYVELFEFFANGNSCNAGKHYWTRDRMPDSSQNAYFCNANNGGFYTQSTKFSYGFLPCFAIGG